MSPKRQPLTRRLVRSLHIIRTRRQLRDVLLWPEISLKSVSGPVKKKCCRYGNVLWSCCGPVLTHVHTTSGWLHKAGQTLGGRDGVILLAWLQQVFTKNVLSIHKKVRMVVLQDALVFVSIQLQFV